MPNVTTDYYGHVIAPTNGVGTGLAAAAVGTANAPGLVIPGTNAGAAPTVTAVNGVDEVGTFTLNAVTGGGAQAAGAVVVINFTQAWAVAPRAAYVYMVDQAAPNTLIATTYTLTAASLTVNVTSALTTAHNYTVVFKVFP